MRFTDKEFFDYEMANGLHPGNENFYAVHKKVADFINGFFIIKERETHLDLGAGNSPLTKILQDYGWKAAMVERNPYSLTLQINLGVYDKRIFNEDFTQTEYPKYDFITSIEVFEHISDYNLLQFIDYLPYICQYFLFSSTPYPNTPEFDEQWGHINLKPTDEWVRLFEEAGFELMKKETEYLQKNVIPTEWTLMFKSLKYA